MAASMSNLRRLPLVVIMGSTGTGKSKLAIEIGKRVGGEILSADSMQVYKGLDIITNKVTAEELSDCPHHLIDFVSPLKEFSVVEFRNMAVPLIEDIKKRGKVPIVVGGTNYYIESVLWDMLIDDQSNRDGACSGSSNSSEEESEGPAGAIKTRKLIQSSDVASTVKTAGEEGECHCEEGNRSSQGGANYNSEDLNLKTNHTEGNRRSEGAAYVEIVGQAEEGRGNAGNISSQAEEVSGHGLAGIGHEGSKSKSEQPKSLYEKLREVDPIMADRLHPCNSRKIARSLQVYEQHGKQHSQILQEQQQRLGGSTYSGPLRYEHVCVFWLQCERDILNDRLDKRVDQMLERGLINELLDFHSEYNHVLEKREAKAQYTEGIFQSIGFKEFHKFLIKQEGKKFDECNTSKEDKALLSACVENMKTVTRRYAKKQMTWVKNRFLARPQTSAPDVYGLDATDLESWESIVLKNALDILDKVMKGEKPMTEPLPRVVIQDDRHARHVCEICDNRVILGEENWRRHLVSKKHKWQIKREQRNREHNPDGVKLQKRI